VQPFILTADNLLEAAMDQEHDREGDDFMALASGTGAGKAPAALMVVYLIILVWALLAWI
jgi:hypothetical protein